MRRALTAATAALALVVLGSPVGAFAAAAPVGANDGPALGRHDLPSPLSDKQRALRTKAAQLQAQGKIAKDAKVGEVAKGQYVELAREGEDSIFTVLGEFGTAVNPTYGGTAGPQRNQIPQPDRTKDNSTIWSPDFSSQHYRDLLFSQEPGASSMRNFYIENSSGRYAVNGEVTDWVKVPFNEASYGSDYCGGIVCARTWLFVRDSVNAWYQSQIDAGKTKAQIKADLAKFDTWDRYDYDHDGNFNEPDGYIDHFQSIHAGVGEETGGGAQGTDAIWSHRWYAFYNNIGATGPGDAKLGGIQIGDSGVWIGDYTIEPENGGVGVFSHEFGHDLGLPDEYDTSGNTGGAENSTAFWTTWSSGSYGNNGDPAEGIGDRPFQMSSWDKLQLGWLNYGVTRPGDKDASVKLGPAESNTKQTQAQIVVLPDKQVTVQLGDPADGDKFLYSGTGDDLDVAITRQVAVPADGKLTAKVRYDIEQDFDYAYLTVDGVPVKTSVSTEDDPNSNNLGEGITGVQADWTDLTADLSAYAGKSVALGFRYKTDGAQQGQPGAAGVPGLQLDAVTLGGQPLDEAGWTFAPADGGFRLTTGTEQQAYFNAYIAENRQYLGADAGLKTGPYNFGGNIGPDWAERFPYQDGMLVWYWDSSYSDNNVGDHPGGGLILPVDAHPSIMKWADDGTNMRPRLQSFDSTFGLQRTDAFTLHHKGNATQVPSQAAVPVFDDANSYYTSSDGATPGRYLAGWNSVQTPTTGTRIQVVSVTPGGFMQIHVTAPKAS